MKKQFLKSLNIIYKEMINNAPIKSYKDYKFVKNFIFEHPDDEDVLIIKNWILTEYQKLFLDSNFLNALNIADNLRYMKKQLIYNYLPFVHTNQNYPSYFYSLIVSPCEFFGNISNFYKGCFWFFKEQNKCLITDEQIEKINKFLIENNTILKGGIDKYDDFYVELLRYKNILLNRFDNDFDEFRKDKEISALCYNQRYDGNIIKDYENKKLGTIGELYVSEQMKNLNNYIFTARDLGNGFGFDMYFQHSENNIIYENLVEVKTTSKLDENDYFSLSDNEYNTLINSYNYPNVNYFVCRVFVDINNNKFNCHLLKLEDNLFKSINSDLEYELNENYNNNYYFKRKSKVKKLI